MDRGLVLLVGWSVLSLMVTAWFSWQMRKMDRGEARHQRGQR